ncbi:MAG: chromosomal replication initiator protein DnaA [Coprobacillus sp.]|nr:chromosomal replication initiator protein DnaA [Coprobacillus sp.]
MNYNNASVSETTKLWGRILNYIKDALDENVVYDSFFKDTYIQEIEDNTILVVVNSSLTKTLLQSKYKDLVDEAVREITESDYKIEYATLEELKDRSQSRTGTQKQQTFFENASLNPKQTFANFVVGPFNLEANQAATLISCDPGKMFNPLFIYSESGLGKTHLLNAIGNYIVKNGTNQPKVLNISADVFVDEYLRFVKGDKEAESIKDYFKTVDVFLVDDIQFLADKPKTEEMFFYVFSSLVSANKQVVITSDRQPNELKGLTDRLVTRFNQGLVVSIKEPDRETCIEILKKKIEENNLEVSNFDENVLVFIADNFSHNIRELEGALNRLIFYMVNRKKTDKVTLDFALDALSSLTGTNNIATTINEKKIIDIVADYYNLSPSQLTGKIRTGQVALARHIAMYLIRNILTDVSLKKIGDIFGGKDHTTVINGVQRVEKELKTDASLKAAVDELTRRIKG